MHERAVLLVGAMVAIVVALSAVLARSRSVDFHRYVGRFLPGWPWW